ncbi:MAG: diguanylate cyclase [Clostridiales Family XIII bacterium]|nr:diguanylate cyclase [Clostridiales Family XIII bacterium]
MSNKDLEIYYTYLRDVLYYPKRAKIVPEDFSDEGHREFAEAMLSFGGMVIEMRELAGSLSRGELDVSLPSSDNELAAPLKALHSTLKHLTWQTKQVAGGDYDQQVGFMGEFSVAFNEMVAQLAERRREMEAEVVSSKQRTDELAKANSIFEVITSSMAEWIVMVDRVSGEHLFANHQAKSMLASDTFEQQLYDILVEYSASMLIDDEPRKEEFMLISDVAAQYFEMMLYPIKWYEHEAVACVLTDVTANKEEYNRLEEVAYKDVMTGVFNRLYGMRMLEQWTDEKTAFRLVFVDMDMLKYVNDVFGHNEGDTYIKAVAELLQEVSSTAVVCRLGGDEFMVLIQDRDVRGRDMAEVFEGLREKLAQSSVVGENGELMYNRSISFGIIAVGENNVLTTSSILETADERMYEYKKAHKKERRV